MPRGFELNGGLVAAEHRGGLIAIHLDAKGKPADILRVAGVNTPGFGLPRSPAVDGRFGLAGRKLPETGPSGGQREHDKK